MAEPARQGGIGRAAAARHDRAHDALLGAIARLESRLQEALRAADPDTEPHRAATAATTLATLPAPPLDVPVLARLADRFSLEAFDLEFVLLAAAAELDARWAGATVETALTLSCPTAADRVRAGLRLLPGAPLRRHELVRLIGTDLPLPARGIALDERILGHLLGDTTPDPRLAGWCFATRGGGRLDRAPIDPGARATLVAVAGLIPRPGCVCLHGPAGAGARLAAGGMARALGTPLLVAVAPMTGAEQDLRTLAREARLTGASVLLRGTGATWPSATELAEMSDAAAITILESDAPRRLPGVLDVVLPVPGAAQRRRSWQAALRDAGTELPPAELAALGARFRIGPEAIGAVVAEVAAGGPPAARSLRGAAAARGGDRLDRLARRIEPRFDWSDIVLPDDALAQLRELSDRVAVRDRVLDEWGFGPVLGRDTGTTALFAGPSGTGKTMAADVLAHELGLPLYAIDLAGVVSKYIGETEKNLDRLFDAADAVDAILFFDEADALFGKRSEVRDSHDRYANVEISYLLQRMEAHDGVAILATNLSPEPRRGVHPAACVRRALPLPRRGGPPPDLGPRVPGRGAAGSRARP